MIDRLGDWLEQRLPRFLRWDVNGDPASWAQHLLVSLVATLIGVILLGPLGARIGSGIALGYYLLIREGPAAIRHLRAGDRPLFEWRITRPEPGTHRLHVGWLGDGLGDIAGSALCALVAWRPA